MAPELARRLGQLHTLHGSPLHCSVRPAQTRTYCRRLQVCFHPLTPQGHGKLVLHPGQRVLSYHVQDTSQGVLFSLRWWMPGDRPRSHSPECLRLFSKICSSCTEGLKQRHFEAIRVEDPSFELLVFTSLWIKSWIRALCPCQSGAYVFHTQIMTVVFKDTKLGGFALDTRSVQVKNSRGRWYGGRIQWRDAG